MFGCSAARTNARVCHHSFIHQFALVPKKLSFSSCPHKRHRREKSAKKNVGLFNWTGSLQKKARNREGSGLGRACRLSYSVYISEPTGSMYSMVSADDDSYTDTLCNSGSVPSFRG